ncbi:membrane protein [Sinorhizobium americanum]|uniref:membrane protein n=1 Tax=Sinorhizobium americanum TaxID=194963 RepID=UPI00055CED48|nr:membrane protein [Sinorhizobium americanum]
MAKDELSAGFTGSPSEPPTGVRKVAKTATEAVSREANAVVVGAADHPYTATGLALTVGALAFAIGFVVGRSSVDSGRRYWRWE